MIGLVIGIILALGVLYLANSGILPFKVGFVCPVLPT
jgi:hypothetical protein